MNGLRVAKRTAVYISTLRVEQRLISFHYLANIKMLSLRDFHIITLVTNEQVYRLSFSIVLLLFYISAIYNLQKKTHRLSIHWRNVDEHNYIFLIISKNWAVPRSVCNVLYIISIDDCKCIHFQPIENKVYKYLLGATLPNDAAYIWTLNNTCFSYQWTIAPPYTETDLVLLSVSLYVV